MGPARDRGQVPSVPGRDADRRGYGRYLEIDIAETEPGDWPYMGLLAPESLEPGGLLEELVRQSVAFGNELRDTVEEQIRDTALPSIARGPRAASVPLLARGSPPRTTGGYGIL